MELIYYVDVSRGFFVIAAYFNNQLLRKSMKNFRKLSWRYVKR